MLKWKALCLKITFFFFLTILLCLFSAKFLS
uniref:Uncharacterized protein n=1 Tax=Rhizophora mucronata TaxID=61149 RepID=A0A2P2NQN5_RHIMU